MSHEMGNKIGKDEVYYRPLRGETVDGQTVFLVGSSGYNEEVVLLTSGSLKTASWTSDAQHNYSAVGMILWWDIISCPTSGTATLYIDGRNPATLEYSAIYQTSAMNATGSAAIGLKKYFIAPGVVDDGSQFTAVDRIAMPLHWRVRVLHSASGTWNYSVGASYIGG